MMTEKLFGGTCSLETVGRWAPRLQLRASAAAPTAVDGGMRDESSGAQFGDEDDYEYEALHIRDQQHDSESTNTKGSRSVVSLATAPKSAARAAGGVAVRRRRGGRAAATAHAAQCQEAAAAPQEEAGGQEPSAGWTLARRGAGACQQLGGVSLWRSACAERLPPANEALASSARGGPCTSTRRSCDRGR